jgi:hypothetical protein
MPWGWVVELSGFLLSYFLKRNVIVYLVGTTCGYEGQKESNMCLHFEKRNARLCLQNAQLTDPIVPPLITTH